MTQEDKELLLKDLCSRLPYGVFCVGVTDELDDDGENYIPVKVKNILTEIHDYKFETAYVRLGLISSCKLETVKPFLRPLSSMTEKEKEDLLITLLGKNDTKYFQVLPDGSIDNNDAAHQDLSNFNIHWINFDGVNTSTYIDWLNAHHFDYRGLIEKGLAIEVTKENNPYGNL